MTWLVVGLGNPGKKYERTRHNIGFEVANRLAEKLQIIFKTKKNFEIGEGFYSNNPFYIIKPLTFMNLSGLAVKDFASYKNISKENIIVIYDDLDLPVGKIRLRWNGSGGGHKGVASIIQELGSKFFYHLRIGIDRPPLKELVESYVLSRFQPKEWEVINESIEKAVECIFTLIDQGKAMAMNKFNG